MPPVLTVFTPARVTLELRVLGRRPDGYHQVRIVHQAVDLFDRLEVEPADELAVTCPAEGVPSGEQNLVHRALERLRERSGETRGARVRLWKSIPVAAGLGGGSGNAAGALLAARRLWDLSLDPTDMREVAARVGMDVPFFLTGGTALADQRGERVRPLPPEPLGSILLLCPGFPVSTKGVYEALGAAPARPLTTPNSIDSLRQLGRWEGLPEQPGSLINDLEPVTIDAHPVVAELKRTLQERGAKFAAMSGSGPTVFGIFDRPEDADGAARSFRAEGVRALTVRSWSGGCRLRG